ncbi:MAG: permease [Syntrophotaleaceae bacterium]
MIPAAIGLRKHGASNGASAALPVSTPETGVDSIISPMHCSTPHHDGNAAAGCHFFTATVTGLCINLLPPDRSPVEALEEHQTASSCSSGCCEEHQTLPQNLWQRLRYGLRFAFGDLLGDIGKWLLIGILVSGIISFFVPETFFLRYLSGEYTSLLAMLLIGIPIYICASASTPIAAALVLKGLSPGAALVFLLAGPATNAATLTVIGRFWGKKVTVIYLAAIACCSLLAGWLVNRIYTWTGASIGDWVSKGTGHEDSPLAIFWALLLLVLIARSLWKSSSHH